MLSMLPVDNAELTLMAVPAGTPLFDVGRTCQGFPLVLDGEVQVLRESADGRSIELYRVVPGDICLVSSASLFQHLPMSAKGVTTCATRLALLTPAQFEAGLAKPGFRAEVLSMYANRMVELTGLIDAIAFRRLDQRLAAALLGRGPDLSLTHQDLADELGTVREMVSRLLRRFEREGWVGLSREHIHSCDSAALRQVASGGRAEPAPHA